MALQEALRAASRGMSAPVDDDGTEAEDLGALPAGTQAGAFYEALGEFGREWRAEGSWAIRRRIPSTAIMG